MKNNKGFILKKLLVSALILALITIIAVVIIMKNIQKNSVVRCAENYISSVEITIATSRLDGVVISDGIYYIDQNGNITKDEKTYLVDIKGSIPTSGTIIIENNHVVPYLITDSSHKTVFKIDGYTIEYLDKGNFQIK